MGVIALLGVLSAGGVMPTWPGRLEQWFPRGTRLPMVTVGLTLAFQAAWSVAGVVVGGIYWAIRDNAASGLGSPAWGFSVGMTVLAGSGLAIAWTWRRPPGRSALLGAITFAALFGWLLPHLAEA